MNALGLSAAQVIRMDQEKGTGRVTQGIFTIQCWRLCLCIAVGICLQCLSFFFARAKQVAVQGVPGTLRSSVQQLLDAGRITEAEERVRQEVTAHGETS